MPRMKAWIVLIHSKEKPDQTSYTLIKKEVEER